MTEPITLEQLKNASLDAATLEQVINGDENTDVTSRLGATYPTLDRASKMMLENGLLGATPYTSYQVMTSSNHDDNKYAVVTHDRDPKKNGLYLKSAGSWIYLRYNTQQEMLLATTDLIWFLSSANPANMPKYDYESKLLSWGADLVAPCQSVTSKRIKIPAGSISVNVANYSVLYIDMSALPETGNVETADLPNVLKYASYPTFAGEGKKYAIAKYDPINKQLTALNGFLPIANVAAGQTNNYEASNKLTYNKTTAYLDIFFQRDNALFSLSLVNFTSEIIKSKQWRLGALREINPTTNQSVAELVSGGEWECAIRHTENTHSESEPKDYVGGYHGDELATDTKFYVDGLLKSEDFVQTNSSASTIELVQKSIIYYQSSDRQLCEHYKHIKIDAECITVKQKIKFLATVHLSNAWIAMLPVNRDNNNISITTHSATSDDYFVGTHDNTSNNFPQRIIPVVNGTTIKQWSNTSGYFFETRIKKAANVHSGQYAYVAPSHYNKLYIGAIAVGGSTVQNGEEWTTEAVYKFGKG